MFAYATERLRPSESQAYERITVARRSRGLRDEGDGQRGARGGGRGFAGFEVDAVGGGVDGNQDEAAVARRVGDPALDELDREDHRIAGGRGARDDLAHRCRRARAA